MSYKLTKAAFSSLLLSLIKMFKPSIYGEILHAIVILYTLLGGPGYVSLVEPPPNTCGQKYEPVDTEEREFLRR